MISKKSLLASAALSGLIVAAGCASMDGLMGGPQFVMGECHGINACKGNGACEGVGHTCEGKNDCEGKGWLKMTKGTCEKIKDGKWTPMPLKDYPA